MCFLSIAIVAIPAIVISFVGCVPRTFLLYIITGGAQCAPYVLLISHYFSHIISSHQFGKPKEHLYFWTDLQTYAHFAPKRTLFIDDSESVLKTAANFGIQHIFSIHQPDSQTRQQRHSAFKMIEYFADILPINK